MSRTTKRAVEAASEAASEAARVLAQRSHEARSEPAPEPTEPKSETPQVSEGRVEKLLKARPSVQARDEIIKKRGLDTEETPEPEAKKDDPKPEPAPEVKAVTTEPAAPAPETKEAPKTIRVKVDGEEFDAPAEEVEAAGGVKSFQMMKASENRLAKASKIAEDTRATQAQTAQLVQALLAQQPKKPEPTDSQFIQSKLQSIRFGSDEEGANALQEILNRVKSTQPDAGTIINAATNVIANQQAVAKFKVEFADVMTNPHLSKLAAVLDAERRSKLPQGQAVDWENFYRTIGNELRPFTGRQSQPATKDSTAGTTSQPSVKEERKASITTIPTAAARAATAEPEKDLTPEEERKAWLKDQKKVRGQ